MTLSAHEKGDLANYRIEKARSLLSDAGVLAESGAWASSANRSYYAVLSASRALLALRGQEPESHEGAKIVLSRDYIKTGLLPREFGESLRVLQARRIDSDYGDYIDINEEEARDSLERARAFVAAADSLVKRILAGL